MFSSASTWMGDPGFLQWCRGWVGPGLLQWWQQCCYKHMGHYFLPTEIAICYSRTGGGGGSSIMDINTTTSTLLYKHIHVISPDFGGSSRFGAFSPGPPSGDENSLWEVFPMSFFSDRISVLHLSFTAVSTWRVNGLQLEIVWPLSI